AFWCGNVDQTIVVRLSLSLRLYLLLARLRLRGNFRFWSCWLLNSGPGFCGGVDSEAFTINFYDGHTRSLFVKANLYFVLRRLHDEQFAEHVVVSSAADDRALKLKSPNPIGSKFDIDGLLSWNFLVNAKLLELDSVIDVRRSDDQPYGL